MVSPQSRQIQIRPSPDGPPVRRCRPPHDSNPRHQSWNSLSLLRLAAASQWRVQDGIGRIDFPTSQFGRHAFENAALLRVSHTLYNYRVLAVEPLWTKPAAPHAEIEPSLR